ncbi:MAG: alpha/beta fold hydrolase [Planctomycetota bacterium]|jgi:2-hydroxy-6-oxonona-2,4-dienedioate hydrolase
MTSRTKRKLMIAAGLMFCSLAVAKLWPTPTAPARTRPERVSRTPHRESDVIVLGTRLRFIDVGPRDAPPLILIPGHTSRIEEYDAIVPALAKQFRVLVFDFPGTGYSDKPDREYTVSYYVDVLLGFMEALGLDKVHLAGGSLGGNLTLQAAARAPERFVRLAPWAPGSAWTARPVLAALTDGLACYATFWPTVKIQSTYWYSEAWDGREQALAETFTYYEEVMSPGFIRMYWGMAADQVRRSLTQIAGDIPHPTLLMVGSEDRSPGMHETIPKVDALLPRSELRTFEDAPHALASERPDELTPVLIEFLTRPADQLPAP